MPPSSLSEYYKWPQGNLVHRTLERDAQHYASVMWHGPLIQLVVHFFFNSKTGKRPNPPNFGGRIGGGRSLILRVTDIPSLQG